jgi:hypothetical protein
MNRIIAAILVMLLYFPLQYIWDISEEATRGLWCAIAAVVLIFVASFLFSNDEK